MLRAQNQKKIAVAMSGGVDSSVAAFLLKEKNGTQNVFGLTMRAGAFHQLAVERARIICQKLGLSHHVFDLEKIFQKKIIKPFWEEYNQARTPNPCVWCNQKIKFGVLLKTAQKLGANYLATGHYARRRKINGQYILEKALSRQKDQSYFLYRLNQEQLSSLIFPLGLYSKNKVKEIAQNNNLCFKNQKESQDICFIPDNNYRKFLKNNSSPQPGFIKDLKGNILGKHQGLPFYTIGQRKGLVSGSQHPLYVVQINKEENTIILGPEKSLYEKQLIVENITWINNQFPIEIKNGSIKTKDITVKIRYQHRPARISKIFLNEVRPHQVKIEFKKAQRAITPGQSAVIYRGEQVLGGGIIK
jgi:tRNA-specific 2-thiouridylase